MNKNTLSKIAICLIGIIIGSLLVTPIQAATTATTTWIKTYFYTRTQSNYRYYTKTAVNTKLTNYYNKTSVDNLLTDYLTQTDTDDMYLPKSGGTVSGGLEADSYGFNTAQNKVITIPGTAFRPIDNNIQMNIYGADDSAYKDSGTSNNIYAPLTLPDGAEIKQVKMYYYDKEDNFNIWAGIYVDDLQSLNSNNLLGVQSFGAPEYSSAEVNGTGTQIIDNDANSYSLYGIFDAPGTNLRIKAIKITYAISTL